MDEGQELDRSSDNLGSMLLEKAMGRREEELGKEKKEEQIKRKWDGSWRIEEVDCPNN